MAEKNGVIEKVQKKFEQKYLPYCDPLNKLRLMANAVARSIINRLYLIAYHPRQYPDKGKSMTQGERYLLFEKSLKIIEYDNLIRSSSMTRGFLWHFDSFFMWQAFTFLLDYLVQNPACSDWDRAWQQLELVYRGHPAMLTDRSNTLYTTVRGLTLRAWDGREAELIKVGHNLEHPDFVNQLRANTTKNIHKGQAQHQGCNPKNAATKISHSVPASSTQAFEQFLPTPEGSGGSYEPSFIDFDSTIDWSQWDDLIGGLEWQDFNSG